MKKSIVLIVIIVIFTGCNKSASPPDVGYLTKEYKASKEAFRSKYQGKELTVSGFVDRKAMMINETSGGAIYLNGSGESKDTIRCLFDTADSAIFLSRSPNGPLTVKGIVDVSGNGSDIEVKFCKFVST